MIKQEQIAEMVGVMTASNNPFVDIPIDMVTKVAEAVYNAGYRKTFTSELASDTQKAFKEGYQKANDENSDELAQLKMKYELVKAFHNEKCAEFNDLCYDYAKLKVSKMQETAKEILQCLYDKCYEVESFAHIQPIDIIELAKHYGVEVEE